ncbi:MAG: LytTR family transcriptional regulator, partial [Bacteroidales bacterium]|nr:LytTR family transcriptional regulator [Bacteroidales bacterium]
ADNYVNICYKNKERTTKFCLRNTLKNIETMDFSEDLVRCHRSYIINFKKVKILKKEKTGLFVELDDKDIPDIPVSKTYAQQLLDKFNY